jgi:hypothetical protein
VPMVMSMSLGMKGYLALQTCYRGGSGAYGNEHVPGNEGIPSITNMLQGR